MSDVVFRRAREADLRAIVTMLADDMLGAAREVVSDPLLQTYVDAFHAIDHDPNQLLAVAERDGQIVGCLHLYFQPGLSRQGAWRGQIEGVRIASDARGGGLGRAFVIWAIDRCRERDCLMVQLTSDKSRVDAHRFYAALGFEMSHEGMKLML